MIEAMLVILSNIFDNIGKLGVSAIGVVSALAVFIQLIFLIEKGKRHDSEKIESLSKIFNSSHEIKIQIPRANIKNKNSEHADSSVISQVMSGGLSAVGSLGDDFVKKSIDENNLNKYESGIDRENLAEKLVMSYHQQALFQAKIQFFFSIFAAVVGFVYILYASFKIDDANIVTTAKIIPGIAIDAIAAIFFKQSEHTRQRATELYDRLRKDQQMRRAESIAESIENEHIRSAIKAQVALHMAGLSPKEIDIISFVTKPYSDQRS